ncbi:MAG: hypothetical protein HOM01_05300 [Kordiimonadaceae bacterium]|jgi:LPS-assembly lipoprotein|nr:hypothetical protein [Kordiimonadaceae bacterium]
MRPQVKMMMKLLGLLVPLVVSSCGFKPMYGQNSVNGTGLAQVMANIKIDPIRNVVGRQERLSQLLENNLRDRISPLSKAGASEYVLKANFEVEERGYGIRADESVTIQNLKLSVRFSLIDINSDKAVMDGTARAVVTYDLVQSDFSNKTARETSLTRLAEEATNQVVTRVGTFLSNMQRAS